MKTKLLVVSSVALATLLFTGCGIKTSEYNVSADNVSTLRDYKELKLDVGNFTATNVGESSVMCRLAETISTPKGEPFSEYIKEALLSELKMAGVYDKNSDLKISGNVNKVYGSSMFGTKRDYPSSYLATTACNNMGTSFSPTIKQLIGEIINHKDFPTLLN